MTVGVSCCVGEDVVVYVGVGEGGKGVLEDAVEEEGDAEKHGKGEDFG